MRAHSTALLYIHAAALLFGGTALFSRIIPLPALDITVYRCVVACLTLTGLLLIGRQKLRLQHGRDYGIAVLLGVVVGLHWVTYFHSMQIAGVAVGIIALFTYPVITVFIEPLFNRQRPHWRDILAGVVVILGIALIVPEPDLSSDISQGVAIGVLSALLFALRNILHKRYFTQYGGAQAMSYQTAVAALMLLPFLSPGSTELAEQNWHWLLILGVVFSAAPHTLVAEGLRQLKAKTVGLVSCLQPLYATLLAALLLHELPDLRTLIGGALVVAAAFWETWQARR